MAWARNILICVCVLGLGCVMAYGAQIRKKLSHLKSLCVQLEKKVHVQMLEGLPVELSSIPFGEKDGLVLGSMTVPIRGGIYPYNAAIINNDRDGYFLFFRYDELHFRKNNGFTSYISCAELDCQFQQTDKEFVTIDTGGMSAEDPRVLEKNGKLFLVYNDLITKNHYTNRLICMGELDLTQFSLKTVNVFDPGLQPIEKNWSPFVYGNQSEDPHIYFEYSISSRHFFKVANNHGGATLFPILPIASEPRHPYWPKAWGEVRGGTAAQKVGDQYLSFFHSSFKDKNRLTWYCMGAYTFEAVPPFRLTGISHYPILFNHIYETPPMNTADPLKRVIFPCGFALGKKDGKDVIYLSCGENDSAVKIVTLDKDVLLKGLKKIHLD